MEKVLFTPDIFTYIIQFIPKIYCIHLNSICKNINEIFLYYVNKCNKCNNKLYLPIELNNELYCYDCLQVMCNGKFVISKYVIEEWDYLDRCKRKSYLNCKYCNLKCYSLDFAYFHLVYKCNNYKLKTNK